ncbi:MAG: ABC transporter ATP-binding protein [Chloroflexi bacterium]|nr:ABC transporter ATP-binding protein [Chloroflexota bacterium]
MLQWPCRSVIAMQVFSRLLRLVFRYRWQVMAAYLCLVVSTLVAFAVPRVLGEAIDRVLEEASVPFLVGAAGLIVGLALLRGLFSYGLSYFSEWVAQHVAFDLRHALYDHLQRLSFAYHDRQQTGQLMSRATADVENVRWFVSFGVIRAVQVVVMVAALTVLSTLVDWKLSLIALSVLPLLLARQIFVSARLRRTYRKVQERTGVLTTALQENITGAKVVRAFGTEEIESRKFTAIADRLAADSLEAERIMATNAPFMTAMFSLSIALILGLGGREVIRGNLTAGELTQLIFWFSMVMPNIRMVGFLVGVFSRAVSSGERIFEVLDSASPVQERPGAVALADARGHVRFEDVSFSYDSTMPVLRHVSFEAKPGQVVALLGHTGSGKTTIVNLLPRFYDVTGGHVTIDGVDVRDATLASLRKHVGIVQQDVFLFSATVRENIAYGKVNATQQEIEWAAKTARLHDFIAGLPDGYDTWVGERGITLSGGQKQRLAIARGLLTDPRVLILDDSTSSVDVETERLIREALAELMRGRTTFVIAHRLSTVKRANLILVIDDGRIVESGTHTELVARHGPYRRIFESQLQPQEEQVEATR